MSLPISQNNTLTLTDKYLHVPATFPWRTLCANRFMASRMADIDGDGHDEIIIGGWQHSYSESPKLGVLSYFDYGTLDKSWASASQLPQLALSEQQDIASSERILFARLRLTNVSDILVFNSSTGMLSILGYTGLENFYAGNNHLPGKLKLGNLGPVITDTITGQTINPAQPDWDTSTDSSFYAGDIDGDGLDEILVLNHFNTGNVFQTKLGLFKWNTTANALQVIWTSTNGAVPGAPGQPVWNVFSGNKFYIGDIDGDGKNEIVAFDGSAYLGIFKWNKTKKILESYWQTQGKVHSAGGKVPDWTIGKNDWFKLTDVNGDNKKELVAFNGSQLGVFGFAGSQMQVLSVNSGFVPGKAGVSWTLQVTQIHLPGNFEIAGTDAVMATKIETSGNGLPYRMTAMLKWNAALPGFEAYGITGQPLSVTSLNPFLPKKASATTPASQVTRYDSTFATADVDGDGITELVVQNDSNGTISYMKWMNGQFILVWSADSNGLQCWGMGMIANAPVISFASYGFGEPADKKKTCLDIYSKASKTLTKTYRLNTCSSSDIRSDLYTNRNIEDIKSYGVRLGTGKSARSTTGNSDEDWMWTFDFEKDDIIMVFDQLIDEITGVSGSLVLQDNVTKLYSGYTAQRKEDYNTVKDNMQVVPANTSNIDKAEKIGQLLTSGVEGVLSLVQPEMAVGLSLCTSLIDYFNTATTDEVTIDYSSIESWITSQEAKVTATMNDLQTAIVNDPIKLRWCGALSQSISDLTLSFEEIAKKASGNSQSSGEKLTSPENRLGFYRMLMGKVFSIYKTTSLARADESVGGCDAKIPDQAQWFTIRESECDVYKLATSDDDYAAKYPSANLIADLTSNLRIPSIDLFMGGADFNIPVVSGHGIYSDFPQLYTTNRTDKKVMIYLYYGIDQKNSVQSGWLNPGESQIWLSTRYLFGSDYHIKAEVMNDEYGNGPVIYSTSVKITPQLTHNSWKNYAVRVLAGNNNYYWETVK